ncbi:MAG: LysR substrate-binding domain-containing protein [Rhizobiaceae bacterium]
MRSVQLRAFHYVALAGGFTRAAEMLHLTQPAISDQVRKLEVEYDMRLFDRTKKRVSLTRSGEKLYEITRRLFEVEAQALEYLTESRELSSGRLHIIADSPHHVIDILEPFQHNYPDVYISIRRGNSQAVIASLYKYDADIGVLGEIPMGRDFQIIKLSSTPLVAFAAHNSEFAQTSSLSFRELAKLPLVLREPGSRTRAIIEDYAKLNEIELQTRIEIEGREAVAEIVAGGNGVGIVSQAELGNDPRLMKIIMTDATLTMDETLVCLKERRESLLIRSFMADARAIVEKRSASACGKKQAPAAETRACG